MSDPPQVALPLHLSSLLKILTLLPKPEIWGPHWSHLPHPWLSALTVLFAWDSLDLSQKPVSTLETLLLKLSFLKSVSSSLSPSWNYFNLLPLFTEFLLLKKITFSSTYWRNTSFKKMQFFHRWNWEIENIGRNK